MKKAELTDVICAEQNLIRKVGITGRALNIIFLQRACKGLKRPSNGLYGAGTSSNN